MTAITGIATVGIPVRDQDGALAFYRDVLGFEVLMDSGPGGPFRWIELAPRGSGASVALVDMGEPAGVDTGIRLATADAAGDHAALAEAGVDVEAELVDMGPGIPPMFTLRDPDGNTLYVVERPRE
ncbi:MAG TPA: VOC family protein [Thermoleophilaceae bacterium]|nr:VOC family protein [Thermoleophilaceae bacterium]